MDKLRRHGCPAGPYLARRALTLTMATCLLVSCSGPETPHRTASRSPTSPGDVAGRALSPTLGSNPDERLTRLPSMPTARHAAVLARHLDRATATLRAGDSTATDVRRAGQFQQLAARILAAASGAFRRKVTARLHPETAQVTRGAVRASRLLHAMTNPQQRLPRWRIVAPPPATKLLGYYQEAQRRTGVPWNYLAAIHLVETRMGRIRGPSTAGALGPMQFLPSTWALYGAGGDINDPRDAILAAGRLLKANGAPDDMSGALWHYNPSHNYVRAVTVHARTMWRSTAAYRGYWHWRVLYRHVRGTYVLPVGYPDVRPVLLRGS